MLKDHKLHDKVELKWNNRYSTGTWAAFNYDTDGRKKVTPYIDMSTKRMSLNLDKRAIIVEVLRHEIAHALDYFERGYTKHDNHWKEIAYRIGSDGEVKSKPYFKFRDIRRKTSK